jgi:hypothetical protein
VPSCETCTLLYTRCNDSDDNDKTGKGHSAHTSVLRYCTDKDTTVKAFEGLVVSVFLWDAERDVCLKAVVARSCMLRSTPSTILEPDEWLAYMTRNLCSMSESAL